ncbi:MAG: DUF2029 domain-containing protein [Alphaproteobacteria bacterium]|nr:DUF2029 domain-containing protein [Alphaproteobacteria bacterium]
MPVSNVRRNSRAAAAAASVCPLGIFAPWRLQAYGYTLAVGYAIFAWYLYRLGVWLLNKQGVPVYHDFTFIFGAARLALHGKAAAIYLPAVFIKTQQAIVGAGQVLFSNWGYPPIYLLILAPLAALPYLPAFFVWGTVTLLGYVAVIYLIVRRRAAIALALASPFAAWNFIAGQSGALTAALLGAALSTLDRRPMLAGMFIGCLTYKPHCGILLPLALLAGGRWCAIASAAVTTVILAALSMAFFGIVPWLEFPHALSAQADLNLFAASARWGLSQSVYGLMRYLDRGATVAWFAQALTTSATAVIVWLLWRAPVRPALKAAGLSVGCLIATPYAFAYDLATIAVPIGLLAKDQIERGLLRGEQTTLLAIFGISIAAFFMAGRAPVGAPLLFGLLYLILRRAVCRPVAAAAEIGRDRGLLR